MTDENPAQISRVVVLDVPLPQTLFIERVEVRRITMAPGHPAGLHVHNGPVLGNVLAGSVTYQLEGEPSQELRPGDVFYEPAGARVARFDAGPDGAEFLGYFPLAAGQQPELTMLDG